LQTVVKEMEKRTKTRKEVLPLHETAPAQDEDEKHGFAVEDGKPMDRGRDQS
jgi:hypothetical protein